MKKTDHIVEELKRITPLLSQIERSGVYSVPSNYFDNLPKKIIISLIINKQYAYYSGALVPYSIPSDYFINLPHIILEKVLADSKKSDNVFEEMEHLAPILNTISKKPIYSIPEDFFNKIQSPHVISQPPKIPIVSIKRRSKLFRFSVAAVIIPFLAIGLYTLIVKEHGSSNNSNAKNAVKNLSNEEIVTFLKNNVSSQNATSASSRTSTRDHDFKSSLKQVSDKEIHQFLKETGESDEI